MFGVAMRLIIFINEGEYQSSGYLLNFHLARLRGFIFLPLAIQCYLQYKKIEKASSKTQVFHDLYKHLLLIDINFFYSCMTLDCQSFAFQSFHRVSSILSMLSSVEQETTVTSSLLQQNLPRIFNQIINYSSSQYFYNRIKAMIGPSRTMYVESDSEEEQKPNKKQQNQEQKQKQPAEFQEVPEGVNKSFYEMGIPVQSFATLAGHTKSVSCVAIDPKGIRLASGGLDYHVRLWDFHGMNRNMNSFRIIEPFSGNAIRCLNFNTTGTHLMVINGGKQITFLDKDGGRSLLTVKGYMYVKQLHTTKGHTNTVHDGKFHPINANQFASCSGDGSIRLWDMEQKLQGIQQELGHKNLIKCKDAKGLMTGITAITYTQDAKMIFGGCLDGSLQGFSTKNNLHRPEMTVRNAHRILQQYSSIISIENGNKIITRNSDGTLKVWDVRNFTKPIVHYSNLPSNFPGSKMCISPNGDYLVVGTSTNRQSNEKEGYLHFFDTVSFEKLKTITMGETSVTDVTWSKAINQIAIGTTGHEARIFFDKNLSVKGALQAVNKQPRIDKDPKFDYSHPVYLPHSLPIYKQRPTNNNKKDLQELRKDPLKTHKPFMPLQGPNKHGQKNVAYTAIQDLIQKLNANPQVVEDARVPLYQIGRHVDRFKQFTQAYKETQPTQIFNGAPAEQKQFEMLSTIKKICPHCGLKLCTCARRHIYDYEEDLEEEQENEKNNNK